MLETETYYVGIYWGPRKESVAECAKRAKSFLQNLARIDPLFAQWFETGRSLEDTLARKVVEITEASLEALFLEGQQRRSITPGDDELGSLVSMWTGDPDSETVGLGMTCGCYSTSLSISNPSVLDLPKKEPVASRILQTPKLVEIMLCAVSAWEPDWVVVNSDMYRELSPKRKRNAPLIGWITYLSEPQLPAPPLPPSARIIPVTGGGVIIVATDEHFTAKRKEHVEAANRIAEVLDEAGWFD